ncbi:MAG TPA: hypothetical protein VHP31_12380 [Caproicibacter sp.]|nr:hypothetical protein [Caproicibacter sp.]
MLDTFLGNLPEFLFPPTFSNDQDDFLALPDDTQQLLLKKGADSDESLHRQLEEFRMKE